MLRRRGVATKTRLPFGRIACLSGAYLSDAQPVRPVYPSLGRHRKTGSSAPAVSGSCGPGHRTDGPRGRAAYQADDLSALVYEDLSRRMIASRGDVFVTMCVNLIDSQSLVNRGAGPVQGKYEGSVVIPAHNEERVIGRCLEALTGGTDRLPEAFPFEIVVVCNGCTDQTAAVARQFPQVNVIEIPQPSKVIALNAGDDAVTTLPRIYLDADSELSTSSARSLLRAAAHRKDPAIVTASVEFSTAGCSLLARSFVRGSKRTGFVRFGVNAGGVYALNASGRARFEKFPEVTNDDHFVSSLFGTHEQIIDAHARVITRPPRDVRSLIRIRSRIYYGNKEVEARGLTNRPPWQGWRNVAYAVRRTRSMGEVTDMVVYVSINIIAKLTARMMARSNSSPQWQRDDSSRR